MTYRIHQSTQAGASVFVLSGVLDIEHAARPQELLATVSGDRIVFDLVDRQREAAMCNGAVGEQ